MIVPRHPWPKLSETLPYPRDPRRCQACGAVGDGNRVPRDGAACLPALHRWREHDEADRPTAVVVVLCAGCSDRMIGPHPRLYSRLHDFEPVPGSMALCEECACRDGLRCTHGDLKANGGGGLAVSVAKPHVAILCSRGGTQHGCRQMVIWPSAPTGCRGRSVAVREAAG